MHLQELKAKPISELTDLARNLGVDSAGGLRRQELIFSILQAQTGQRADFNQALQELDLFLLVIWIVVQVNLFLGVRLKIKHLPFIIW